MNEFSNKHKGWLISLSPCVDGDIILGDNKYYVYLEYNPIDKFQDHRFLIKENNITILFDGVCFNRNDLIQQEKCDSWSATIQSLWNKLGLSFPKVLRGSFNGFIIDKGKGIIVLFSDHIGSRAVYYEKSDCFIASSDISKIMDYKIRNNKSNRLDKNSAYALLSCGFMLDNNTLCETIKRLTPGCTLSLSNVISENVFYFLNNRPNNQIKEINAIDEIDQRFQNAVKQQYYCDLENSGGHFVALSGGLDSRMTSLVAHKLGFIDQLNFTFSQSEYLDQTIAEKIASDYNHDWIFKSLDTGKYLEDVDLITEFTGGSVLYYGLSHGNSLLKLLNLSQYCILHSGQLGDVIIGTYNSTDNPENPYSISSGAFGNRLINKIDITTLRKYPNEEIGKFYNRGFNGILISGHSMIQQNMETASPFLDLDFMDYCLRMPLKYRRNHYIYKKWILSKYPEFAKYPWEKIKAGITIPTIDIAGRRIPLTRVFPVISNAVKNRFFKPKDILINRHHMNPIAFHIMNNRNVYEFINEYFADNIGLIKDAELKNDIVDLVKKGNAFEKVMVISLLSAVKRFSLN